MAKPMPSLRGYVALRVWLHPAEADSIRHRCRQEGLSLPAFLRRVAFPPSDAKGRPVDPSSGWLSRKVSKEQAIHAHDALAYGADALEAEVRGMRRLDPESPRIAVLEGMALDWRATAREYRRIVEDYQELERARRAAAALPAGVEVQPAPSHLDARRRGAAVAANPALTAALSFGSGRSRTPNA